MTAQLSVLLDEWSGALAQHARPSLIEAYEHLGPGSFGWTEEVYGDAAIAAWQEILDQFPNDFLALHHWTVAHHARAFDLEQSNTPIRANADWQAAMEGWSRLVDRAEFWEHIKWQCSAYENGNDIVDVLQKSLPKKLLKIHCDIALDPDTRIQRARYHIRLLRETTFSDEVKTELLSGIYDAHMREVPPEVWRDDVSDLDVLHDGIAAIEQYLEMDPDSIQALCDALRLHVRMLHGWYGKLNEGDTLQKTSRKEVFTEIHATADSWESHFRRLTSQRHTIAQETRDELSLWYYIAGEAAAALKHFRKAEDLYQTAVSIEPSDDEERRRCANGLLYAQASTLRQKATTGRADVLNQSRQMMSCDDLSLPVIFVLADTMLLLDQFDEAETLCRRGIDLSPTPFDSQPEVFRNGQEALRRLLKRVERGRRREEFQAEFESARELMQQEKWDEAISRLDLILNACPDDGIALLLRCRCRLFVVDVEGAQQDLAAFEAAFADDASAKDALRDLSQSLALTKERIAAFGQSALKLKAKADIAWENRDLATVERFLRQALACTLPGGHAELSRELATALFSQALTEVTAAQQQDDIPFAQLIAVYEAASAQLSEAAELAPDEPKFKRESETLSDITQHLKETETRATRVRREFGSDEAYRHHQNGVAAWNQDRCEEGITYLRLAHTAAPNSRRVRNDLASMLHETAVKSAHELGNVYDAEVFDTAREMLSEAARLDPNNEIIQSSLQAVKQRMAAARF